MCLRAPAILQTRCAAFCRSLRVPSPGKRGDDARPLRATIAAGLIGHGAQRRAARTVSACLAARRGRVGSGPTCGYVSASIRRAVRKCLARRRLGALSFHVHCWRRGDQRCCEADNSIHHTRPSTSASLVVARPRRRTASSPRQLHKPRISPADRNFTTWRIPC